MKMLMLQSFLQRSAGEAKREQGEDVAGKQCGTALFYYHNTRYFNFIRALAPLLGLQGLHHRLAPSVLNELGGV